ncbi:hypothetical protein CJ178_03060 [Rhodococcus sp. ACPA4]|jgi:hypothetical protein|uniref:DUF5997 family protein n=2 Tax=Nocardiaceae TaxID=85025 RepID=A0ABU4BMR1_RHOGO|nr:MULTISPECIES: DUF5997 family protein [Rhodococcus]NMD61885.1 hypothetical protein [Nocardia globerula]MCE4263351.1 hypothetical protein [Rhodococcus globerulus]MDV6265474.1 DUF5997 family protein [Rhodococcus globerulus]MDV8070197.1 DUF5997 family protein [Rhodococcus sp. IEGM 1366]NRI64135.1 hypothetical protein [Rhodococcus sp. MS16]
MTSNKTPQTMKPTTAAKKLGVYLEATPKEFQEGDVTREELTALQTEAPEWLLELRRTGPHPKQVIAAKLGISIAGLARGGVEEALTTDQVAALLEEKPEWLEKERALQAEVRAENLRIKEKRASRRNQPRKARRG